MLSSFERRIRGAITLLLFCFFHCVVGGSPLLADDNAMSDKESFFEAKIRPVLIEHCYSCHSSAEKMEGGLAVDFEGGLLIGGDSGPALVAGNASESLLLQVIRHEVDGMEMPLNAPKLSDDVIRNFEIWINQGAADPRKTPPVANEESNQLDWSVVLDGRKKWWSLQPIVPAAAPEVKNHEWSDHPIDRFLLSKLEQAGLEPAEDAAVEVLIRRLFFVLIGLPPDRDELTLWTARLSHADAAAREQAYVELVDELIARPQFGERWARHWMDWFRYAESHGSEGDPEIVGASEYRDYLIRSFNADIGYDQLLREYVAGDLLESPRVDAELKINESIIGPAQWRMVFHGFTPTDALDEKVRFVDDAIDVFSKATQAMTVSCARCHHHKFDAISHDDYYAIFGVISSCRPGRTVIDLPEVQDRNVAELHRLKSDIRDELLKTWLHSLDQNALQWDQGNGEAENSILHPLHQLKELVAQGKSAPEVWSSIQAQLRAQQEQSAQFDNADHYQNWKFDDADDVNSWNRNGLGLKQSSISQPEYVIALNGENVLSNIFPRGLYSHGISNKHGARAGSVEFDVAEDLDVWMLVCGEGGATARYVIQHYPRNGLTFPILQPNANWQWHRQDLSYWNGDKAYVEFATALDAPLPVSGSERSWFGVRQVVVTKKGATPPAVGAHEGLKSIVEQTGTAIESVADLELAYVTAVRAALKDWQRNSLSDDQAILLQNCLKERVLSNDVNQSSELKRLVERYRQLEQEIPVPRRVPGLEEAAPQDQHLYVRGNHKTPGHVVPRRFLEAIDARPFSADESGRRELAERLLDPSNPLTRRVIVNRIWHHVFGRGLVSTPDNFGKMGATPTHPELLDQLALDFSKNHWSIKRLIRELVLTRAWRMDSVPSELAREKDPENALLSHAFVRRLDAEAVRDALLDVSTKLQLEQYGSPVNGTVPRRSVYVAVRRNALDPFLRVFDFPEPFSAVGKRDVTNVPGQALTMMNDPFVGALATDWARNISGDVDLTSDSDRLAAMMQDVVSRIPTQQELGLLNDYLQSLRKAHQERQQQRSELDAKVAEVDGEIRLILDVLMERSGGEAGPQLEAFARWDFSNEQSLAQHAIPLQNENQVDFRGGTARFDGASYLVSSPLEMTLREKSMEVWVQPDDYDQRGGGVMTLQLANGDRFDSIVLGEIAAGEWIAGSDFFNRTRSFEGPAENGSSDGPIHLMVTYSESGLVTAYRNGDVYGKPYQVQLEEFPAGQTIVSFGVRHLPAGGNRMFKGTVAAAALYDRCLTPDDVRWAFNHRLPNIGGALMSPLLTDAEKTQLAANYEKQKRLREQINSLPAWEPDQQLAVYTEIAKAMFLMKEFVYLR
ncbi:DUF1553 domain-containing protein [Planctomicrobium sp. SH668]|uniref:DUF1553 domain-containing protein n=1 Tax=Planctomicrobium sp. SH668 TaxID=3448126 RepID=UPI003F5BAA65